MRGSGASGCDDGYVCGLRSAAESEPIAEAEERVGGVEVHTGLSRNHYQLLERGLSDRAHGTPSDPRLSTLIALSIALETSVAELLVDIVYPGTDTPIVSMRTEGSDRHPAGREGDG